jgi:5-methylcytosine-specific restriction endonuclease McrA
MSHVKSKGAYKHMAWDLENVKMLCYRCHILWWHKEPTEAGEWFKEKFPERWEYLVSRMRETPKVNIEFLEGRIQCLQKE